MRVDVFVVILKLTGDARLAKGVKNKVHSFDLVANDPSVIACDMSNVCLSFFLHLKPFIIGTIVPSSLSE